MASLFVLGSLSIILALSLCCRADLIADICAQSGVISPTTCALILRSEPRSQGADLESLSQIVIKKAKIATKDTATITLSIRDPNNTYAVQHCVDVCGRAIDLLNEISLKLKNVDKRNLSDLIQSLSGAGGYVQMCDLDFAGRDEGLPAELEEDSRIAQGLIIVLSFVMLMM